MALSERHGLGGVLADAWEADLLRVEPELSTRLASRRVAQDLEHGAHLALLRRIDQALSRVKLTGVILKGVLFAERYYPRPSARGTTDVDLLVCESDLAATTTALEDAGYCFSNTAEEQRFRLRHHHLHLTNPESVPLELHFHAYRGFGRVMRSAPLIQRSVPSPPYEALRVLSRPDELVYLAVHAASHRFERLSWLYDIKLLLARMSDAEVVLAKARAQSQGLWLPLALAARRLRDEFGVDVERFAPGRETPLAEATRLDVARTLAPTPSGSLLRSATRFLYTLALSDGIGAQLRYVKGECQARAEDAFARGRARLSGRSDG